MHLKAAAGFLGCDRAGTDGARQIIVGRRTDAELRALDVHLELVADALVATGPSAYEPGGDDIWWCGDTQIEE